ncbi:MAG: hypothetical protein MI748_17225 [Opitutales bacterium]|nr:hypothetical protein [Opitutales bacterium]
MKGITTFLVTVILLFGFGCASTQKRGLDGLRPKEQKTVGELDQTQVIGYVEFFEEDSSLAAVERVEGMPIEAGRPVSIRNMEMRIVAEGHVTEAINARFFVVKLEEVSDKISSFDEVIDSLELRASE